MKLVELYNTSLNQGNAFWMATIARSAYERQPDGKLNREKFLTMLKVTDPLFEYVAGASSHSCWLDGT